MSEPPATSMNRPLNILLVFCDQLRADALGCAGNPIVHSPNIDRLAQRGVQFTQCMVTQPTCTPCRASALTGVYPSALRSRMVGCYTPDDARFLPRVFAARGYRTASIGKVHLVPQGAEPGAIAQTLQSDGRYDYYGFREIDLVNGHGDHCFGPRYSEWLRRKVPEAPALIKKARRYAPGVSDSYTYELPAEVHSSNYIGDRTVEFLRDCGDDPFFLHVSFPDPHHPFTVPEPYASMYDPADMPPPIPPVTESVDVPALHLDAYYARNLRMRGQRGSADRVIGTKPERYDRYTTADWQRVVALYYGMISLVDHNIGKILGTLQETGLAGHTFVVFTSDHGDYLGDHGLYGKGLAYDGSIHAPLIYSGPGVQGGRQIDSMASTLDIAPTLLDVAGLEEPEGVQGCSLKEALSGEARTARTAALTENDDDFVAMKMRVLTTTDWKLVYYCGEELGELYDRRNDPHEMVNLWNDAGYAARRTELMGILLEEIMCGLDVSNGRRQPPHPPQAIKWTPKHG